MVLAETGSSSDLVSPRTIRKRILKVTILARNPQATRSDIAFIYNGFLPRS